MYISDKYRKKNANYIKMKNLSFKQFKILPHMKEIDDILVEKLLKFDSAMPWMWAGLSSPLNNACELRCCTTTESLQTSRSPPRTPAQCEMIIYISGVSSFSLALLRLITVEEMKKRKTHETYGSSGVYKLIKQKWFIINVNGCHMQI